MKPSLSRRLVLALALLVVACSTTTFIVQQYEGAPRDTSQVAVLRLNGGTPIVVVALDGEELDYSQQDEATRVHIEVLPGVHELDVGNLDDPLRRVVKAEFVAEAGRVYRLTIDAPAGGLRPWRPLVWVVDRDSDRALEVAKLPPPPKAPTAASAAPVEPPAPLPSSGTEGAPTAPAAAPTANAAPTSTPAPSVSVAPAPTPAPVPTAPSPAPKGT